MYAAALQQVIGEDPVQSRLQAVLAPALAPVLQYVARTPALSDAIASVAGVNSTLVHHLSAKAHPRIMMARHDTRHPSFQITTSDVAVGRAHSELKYQVSTGHPLPYNLNIHSFIHGTTTWLQVQQLTQIATPLLNTFSQGILQNPAARQALQDLTVTPNLEQLIQGLQNLTAITNPPVFSLLVRRPLSEKSCPIFASRLARHARLDDRHHRLAFLGAVLPTDHRYPTLACPS